MLDGEGTTAGADAPVGTQGSAVTTTAAATAAQGGADAPTFNHKEFVELRKEQRETRDLLKQLLAAQTTGGQTKSEAPKTEPKPAAGGVDALQAQLDSMRADAALGEALADAGVTPNAKQREAIKVLYRAANQPDMSAWLPDVIETLGIKKQQQAAPAPQPVTTPSNQGAPKPPTTEAGLPTNPFELPQDVLAKMSQSQLKAAIDAWKRGAGQFEHPFKQRTDERRAARSGSGGLDALAARLAEKLPR